MMKGTDTAILTIAVGRLHEQIYKLTRPTVLEYVKKLNCDFVEITSVVDSSNPKLLKFKIRDYLNDYRRIIYLDGDIAISPFCPNLFDIVPETCFGAACEAPPFFNRDLLVQELCEVYGVPKPDRNCFINTGMMVVSKMHQALFDRTPRIIPIQGFYDQPYINAKLIASRYQIHDLGLRFNHAGSLLLRGARPFGHGKAYIVHATGALARYRLEYLDFVTKLWTKSQSSITNESRETY